MLINNQSINKANVLHFELDFFKTMLAYYHIKIHISVLSIMYITMLCQEDIHVLKESFSLQYFRMELLYAEKVNKISLVPSIIPKQYIFSN